MDDLYDGNNGNKGNIVIVEQTQTTQEQMVSISHELQRVDIDEKKERKTSR